VVGTAVPGPGVAVEQPEADSVIAARVTPRGRNFFTGTAFLREQRHTTCVRTVRPGSPVLNPGSARRIGERGWVIRHGGEQCPGAGLAADTSVVCGPAAGRIHVGSPFERILVEAVQAAGQPRRSRMLVATARATACVFS